MAPEVEQRVEGANKAHENGEAMGLVGVRLTDQLGSAIAIYEAYLAAKKLSLNDFCVWAEL